ncbi:MAG TPA: DUF411 domain-containing protein [Gemmatimonadales bacterium]|jgi:hypothetical protein|nr:DUF411 domain-containing protein [Gemmatimonadales bacterium]
MLGKQRLQWGAFGAACVILAAVAGLGAAPAPAPVIIVYKSATCGCCKQWVAHLSAAGFQVITHDTPDLDAVMTELGVPRQLAACHTAVVQGYAIEGHVPADLIQRLLQERPRVAGLAVPGMPAGSPGMQSGAATPYQVLTFDSAGKTTVYATR